MAKLCSEVRAVLREISQLSGVPIEPRNQTELLDDLVRKVPEVIFASVPGAGGDDAIFALGLKDSNNSLASQIKRKFLKEKPNLALLPVKLTGTEAAALTVELDL